MPSNQTTNYNLSQWSKSDQVKMEDFNADNAKIDAAIKAVADSKATIAALTALTARVTALENKSRFTKLWETTLTANITGVTIPLSGVNWSQWDKVHLDLYVMNGPSMRVYYNGTTQGDGYAFAFSNPTLKSLPWFTLYPEFKSDRLVQGVYEGRCTGTGQFYSELTRLTITGGTLYTGSKFTLWGEV